MGCHRKRPPRNRRRQFAHIEDEAEVTRTGSSEGAVAQVTEAELLNAISSLYDDQLKPYGRIIRKRISEDRQSKEKTSPAVAEIRVVCEQCRQIRVEAEAGGEYAALLVDRAPDFVDIYGDDDRYTPELWAAAAEYFDQQAGVAAESGDDSLGSLPGGRYASAVDLVGRRLPFLAEMSLGQVCHIVQLAITQKQMLGYLNGGVVPYRLSTSMTKSQRAQELRSTSKGDGVDLAVAQQILRKILQEREGPVPLSNIKRIFRSEFDMELSETALGHSKISDLLADARFAEVCSVRLVDCGYMVFAALPGAAACGEIALPGVEVPCGGDAGGKLSCAPVASPLSASTCSPVGSPTSDFAPSPALRKKRALPPLSLSVEIHRTFIHAPPLPPTPMGPSALRRSSSVPKNSRLVQGELARSPLRGCVRPPSVKHANTGDGPSLGASFQPFGGPPPQLGGSLVASFQPFGDPTPQSSACGLGAAAPAKLGRGIPADLVIDDSGDEAADLPMPLMTPSPQWADDSHMAKTLFHSREPAKVNLSLESLVGTTPHSFGGPDSTRHFAGTPGAR